MRDSLNTLGLVLIDFLEQELPSLGSDWWQVGVENKLSYQQRTHSYEYGWSDLNQLDVAALLRVVDGNWDLFRRNNTVSREARNWLKEAMTIRNRWAHISPGHEPSAERTYRDLDTLTLLADALLPNSEQTALLQQQKEITLNGIRSHDQRVVEHRVEQASSENTVEDAATEDSLQPLSVGDQVRLKSRPETTGVVTKLAGTSPNMRITVFHGAAATNTYFEEQLELVPEQSSAQLSAAELKIKLTTAHVLHPSVNRLYSFNSGRIEYEPYQFRPVMKLINADQPRLLIADDVGVGKTIEAGLVIKELEARQKLNSILVICPKPLVVESKWRDELKRFDEDFAHLDSKTLRFCLDEAHVEGQWPSRYKKAILPYSLLDERLLLGSNQKKRSRVSLLDLVPPVKFDLVIVDEAHHVRNKDTWRHRVVKYFMDSAEAAILISATPVQTSSDDLKNLLGLIRPDMFEDNEVFRLMMEPNTYLAKVDEQIRVAADGWQDESRNHLESAMATTWGQEVLSKDSRAQELHDILALPNVNEADRVKALRRSQALNTFSGLINRTRRRDIGSFTTRKPETFEVEFTAEQREVYQAVIELAGRISRAKGHQSSLDFVLSTLQRQAASSLNGLAPYIDDILKNKLTDLELSELGLDAELERTDLFSQFEEEIQIIADKARQLREDPKLDRLLGYVSEKQEMPNNKLLLFSTFRHTLAYIADTLLNAGVRVGLIHGGIPDEERLSLRTRFAKQKEDPDALDVLLSSEVGTEGLDYQFCDALVNYDLPWNPMRIEQRIGRIDRRGQQSEAVAIKNMIVAGTVDASIYERCLSRIGVFRGALGGSEAILGEVTQEIRKIGEDLTLSEEERNKSLQQLADNKLGRIQEQEELEERESSLFGLTLQKLDDDGVEQVASPWLAAPQLASLVQEYLKSYGYSRADSLFERQVSSFRPDKTVREALNQDQYSKFPQSASPWARWLLSPDKQSRRLTFNPEDAVDSDTELLSPVHELVRVAAQSNEPFHEDDKFALRITTDRIPAGVYPILIHSWTYLGLRDDFEIDITSTSPEISSVLAECLLEATDSDEAYEIEAREHLEAIHYDKWLTARSTHIDNARALAEAQLSSLKISYQARQKLLQEQIRNANHENIVRMRSAELKSVVEDFESRSAKLKKTVERSDLTTQLLCAGTVEVV